MGRTKRVKSTGRFGARYGVGIRKRLLKVEGKQKKYYTCPSCGSVKAKRTAAGIYSCRKCGATFAGGAYLPVTLPGSIVQKMVTQRSFLPKMRELLTATEGAAEGEAAGAEDYPAAKKPKVAVKEERKKEAGKGKAEKKEKEKKKTAKAAPEKKGKKKESKEAKKGKK